MIVKGLILDAVYGLLSTLGIVEFFFSWTKQNLLQTLQESGALLVFFDILTLQCYPQVHPDNVGVQWAWLEAVFPVILDPESSMQEKCAQVPFII